MKFVVHEASADGGWGSPGITQQYPAEPGGTYRVSYRIRCGGCDYAVNAGGVAPKTGAMRSIDRSTGGTGGWEHVERSITIPEEYPSIRFELNVLSSGNLSIDDVRIEPVPVTSAGRMP